MKTKKMKKPMHRREINRLYVETEKLMYKLAWGAAARYGWNYKECLSECHAQFVRAVNGFYRPSRGMKFSSFLYQLCQWRFTTMRMKETQKAIRMPIVEVDEEKLSSILKAPAQHSPCLEAFGELSRDAREIVALLVETPEEILEEVTTAKQLLCRVKEYLRKRGRSKKRLKDAHREIQTTFRTVWQQQTAMT